MAIDLIRDFSKRDRLPIDVQEVVDAITARGIKDEIYYFWDHNLDATVLRGYIKHDEYPQPDGTSRFVAEITYGKLGDEWERLVCCKELLHLVDPIENRAANAEAVERLVEKIVLPPDMVDPFSDGVHANSDRLAIIHAVAVLFPLAARNILLPAYTEKKLTPADISDLAELPPRYAVLVMSEQWEDVHNLIVK